MEFNFQLERASGFQEPTELLGEDGKGIDANNPHQSAFKNRRAKHTCANR